MSATGRAIAGLAGILLLVLPVLWQLDPGRVISSWINLEQFATAELTLALLYLFSSRFGAGQSRARNAVLLVASAAAVVIGVLLVRHYGSAMAHFILPTTGNIALSLALAVLTLTACWMASGKHFVILIGLFLTLGYTAQFIGGAIAAPPISAERYAVYLTFGGEGFLGNALRVISQIVVVFIGFGVVANLIGATGVIEKIAMLATRKSRGAAIKVAVLSSALFGTISGSATSNVMTSGTFSITSMRRLGLTSAQAGGVEAVASTLGQVIPPIMGAAAFLMADFTGLSYLTIAAAATLPAIFCVLVLFLNADRMARSVKAAETAPEYTGHGLTRRDLLYLLPVVGIFATLVMRPDKVGMAGVVGMGLCIVAGLLRNGVAETLDSFRALPARSGRAIANLVVTASALGCIIAVLAITGFDVLLSMKIGQLGEANLFLSLLLCALAAVILGTGMATSGVYIVVAIMLAPGLVNLGIPVLAAHMFVFYFAVISMITPPVAFAVLAASGLSGAGFYRTAFAALRFGWILFVMPFLIVYFPGLLLLGTTVEILQDLVTVVAIGIAISLFSSVPGLLSRARHRNDLVSQTDIARAPGHSDEVG
ncbi:TRAP transporter fused permease subunit [Vannielia litorea]|uniref:TRAP transporter permease n=1 Tax=Vannielia litorea TaxID=1217970 RepID=UPI001C97FB77|nr:TRAP transporter fused permease subunit [Vannielia litorea]MBY6153795.1 TRAP transporter fused permease subunit [Vannielia litorea]